MKARLRRELRDLTLVAIGAIPGALLRWRLAEDLGSGPAAINGITLANLLGCLLLGLLLTRPGGNDRRMLVLGIGFCGSLTTFSSWMLQLADALRTGRIADGALVLTGGVLGGVAMVALGHRLGSPRG
ncbi:MAG: fluoride efflux transporter FluC [Synechococcus sp.]